MLLRLSIDYENRARHWWESGGDALWRSLCGDLEETAVVLEESIARSWLAEAARIAGWSEGPEYAPHPIAVREVSEDEEL